MSVKLGDVGIRRVIAFAEVILVQRMASAWSAPEVLAGSVATKASDVYSFGVICWELMARKVPYEGRDISFIRDAVCKKQERLRMPAQMDIPPAFIEMVEKCWSAQPDERLSFQQIAKILDDLS